MKKTSLIIMTLLLVFVLGTGTVFAETSGQTVNLVLGQSTAQINGKDVTMTAPAQVVSGSTLVPLRFVGEAFGCDVQWISDTRTAMVTLEDQTIEVPIGQTYAVINGEKINVAVPGQLINGSTFVPLRFIGENLGAKVDYDATTKGISILLSKYHHKDLNFETVLPAGWTVEEETAEDVTLSIDADRGVFLSLVDKGNINESNFASYADDLFKDYKTKSAFSSTVDGNVMTGSFQEDGISCTIVYELLDSGILCAVAGAPVDTFDDAFAAQCNIIINSFKSTTK